MQGIVLREQGTIKGNSGVLEMETALYQRGIL